MTIKEFTLGLNEDLDIFLIDEVISETRLKEIEISIYSILSLVKSECPGSIFNYTFIPTAKPESLLIDIIADSGDWIETKTESFTACVRYTDRFNIDVIEEDRVELKFLFSRLK